MSKLPFSPYQNNKASMRGVVAYGILLMTRRDSRLKWHNSLKSRHKVLVPLSRVRDVKYQWYFSYPRRKPKKKAAYINRHVRIIYGEWT